MHQIVIDEREPDTRQATPGRGAGLRLQESVRDAGESIVSLERGKEARFGCELWSTSPWSRPLRG
jgi:hypothetical protein